MLLFNEILSVLLDGSWSSMLVLVCGLYAALGLMACVLDVWNVLTGSPDRLILMTGTAVEKEVCDE